jgi:hypothetical protein
MKGEGAPELTVTQRWEGGVGWMAYPEETMQRASAALVDGEDGEGDVWVIDPVDAPELDDLFAEFGEVVGVALGLDRHKRDAAVVANRHDAPVYVPDWMTGVEGDLDAPVERYGRELGDSGIDAFTIRDSSLPPWQEVGFYRDDDGTLVVPEAVGNAPYYLTGDERLGVHPMLRFTPPKAALRSFRPERVLPGHGSGVEDDAAGALRRALDGSRKNAPSLYLRTARMFLG